LLLAEVHSVFLGHWELIAAELFSSGIASPSGLAIHSENTLSLLALGPFGCSDWLLWQEGEVSNCSAYGIVSLSVGCAGGTATTEGTDFGIAADADTGSGADIPKGDSA
jgi:hypothetical protein